MSGNRLLATTLGTFLSILAFARFTYAGTPCITYNLCGGVPGNECSVGERCNEILGECVADTSCTGTSPSGLTCAQLNGFCLTSSNKGAKGSTCGPNNTAVTASNCARCCVSSSLPSLPGNNTVPLPSDPAYTGPAFTSYLQVVTPVAKILYYVGLLIGLAFIVLAGYTLMTSEGNPQKVQQGQEQLTGAILGILFILLSGAIMRMIINNIINI